MVESSYKNYLNRKRGISTIVGGIIFLVLLTAGFSTFFVAMDVQSDTINAQRTISNSIIEKTQEKFSIGVATDDTNPWHELGIQVKNEGSNPIQISNIWIINKSQAGLPAKSIPINSSDAYIPAGYSLSILETQRLTINPALIPGDDDLYDIKVVSTIGTIKQTELSVGGNNYLQAELFTIPPDVAHNENVTLALRVTNVGSTDVTGITPNALLVDGAEITIPSPHPWVNGVPELVTPLLVPVDLKPSESTIFSWHTQLNAAGTFGDKMKFTNSASGIESSTGFAVSSNVASDKMTVRDPNGGGGSGTEVIIKQELFGQPQIFMIFPNPAGIDLSVVPSRGLWGVMVANPTDQPMFVSKVVIAVVSPRANSDDKIFSDGCGSPPYDPVAITPFTVTADWSCPKSNQLVWRDIGDPIIVQPRSVHPFLVRIGSEVMNTGDSETGNFLVNAIVFTDLGQFGKAGYASTMQKKDIAIPNVFLSKVENQATSADTGNMMGNITRIPSGTPVVFNATLVDMSSDSTNEIEAGTKLIINVPKEWTFSHIAESTDFTMQPVQIYPDGSTQIVGVLDVGIDDPDDARIIKFYATAPAVTDTKMYIMHILAHGTATGDDSKVYDIGPLSEVVLQVCPSSGICVP